MVLVFAFVALCLLGLNYFSRTAQPNVLGGLTKGMQFPALPAVRYDGFKATLLIVLNSDCSFCSESVPFYKRLLEAQRKSYVQSLSGSGIRVIAVTYKESRRRDDQGNWFRYRAKVTAEQGVQAGRWAWDVFVQKAD